MARWRKGVITVGATYGPAEGGASPTAACWRLDPAGEEVRAGNPDYCAAARDHVHGLVHEVIDHWIPGFGPQSHRAEAKALLQYAARTGADPLPALQRMVEVDLLEGRCEGEGLDDFLPCELRQYLPAGDLTDGERMRVLRGELGDGLVRTRLTTRLVDLGWEGMAPARATWIGRGLDFRRRRGVADALQRLQDWMEDTVRREGLVHARGELAVASDMVRFRFEAPDAWEWAREVRSV